MLPVYEEKNHTPKAPTLLMISLVIVLFSKDIGIFWDNVLFVSKMGKHLFSTGLFNWNFPNTFDPGHPPFTAFIMAIGWTIFGKSLAISHWIMLPFIFGLLWQLHSFVTFFIEKKSHQFWAYLLVLADPSLLSQLVLVNPEVIQLFFFFSALNALLRRNMVMKIISLAFLGITTYRGMMLCGGIFFIELLYHLLVKKGSLKKFFTTRLILEYFLGALPAILYITWRLLTKGWLISNPLEHWGNALVYHSFADFITNFGRNMVVLIHRFSDFGRLVILLFAFLTLWNKRNNISWKKISLPIIIVACSTIVVASVSLVIKNPMGHRYFIASYLALALLAYILIEHVKRRRTIYAFLILALLGGNFIIYPDKISQGWDASLAHLPYWGIHEKAINYINEHPEINIERTASFFPNKTQIDNIQLNGDKRSFTDFSGNEKFVFYSNVFNIGDNQYKTLKNNYTPFKTFQKWKIRIVLYKKKEV